MKKILPALLLLASCATSEPVLAPVEVDVPVAAHGSAPDIEPPPELLRDLPANADLTAFTKACAAESLYARAYIEQLQAALKNCAE